MGGCPRLPSRPSMLAASSAACCPCAAHHRAPRRHRRKPAYRIDRGRRSRGALALCRRRSGDAHVHAQRAEAAAGVAVRRGGRRRTLRLYDAGSGAVVRESLRRTAACGSRRGHAGQGRQHARRTCNAARMRRCSSTRVARCRRRRPIRRSRTTARASTAECSRIAWRAATASTITWPSAIRCSRTIRARGRRVHRRARGSARRRRRRLLGAELCDSARQAGARVRAPRRRRRRRAVRPRAAHAGRRDVRASGNGLGRAAQRSGACARRARRLGVQDRRRRRAGDRGPQPRLGHCDQGRRRQRARAASGDGRHAGAGRPAGRRRAPGAGGLGASLRCATSAVRSPARRVRLLSWTKPTGGSSRLGAAVPPNELNPPETVCYGKCALRSQPGGFASGGAVFRRSAAPAIRRDNNE